MSDRTKALTDTLITALRPRHAGQEDFLGTVAAIADDVMTIEKASAEFTAARVMERLAEPDRVLAFRIVWRNDAGAVRINHGWRVQHSNLLGPYKGGLRWHPETGPEVLKSLAFEQSFKNALTGLPLGGAKGGADFDPRGRSQGEIERFALAFMAELAPHIGPARDVPAGDMGVGAHELGILTRAWTRHSGEVGGALTGKPLCLGGSLMRTEATGFGLVYFLCAMLAEAGEERGAEIAGRRIAISGRGNVAGFAARKALALGARVLTLSSRQGVWHAPDGMHPEALDWLLGTPTEAATNPPRRLGLTFLEGRKPWALEPEIALPCATQDELDETDARALVDGGCRFLAEGANMPCTRAARTVLHDAGVTSAPGKAANAGGVAVSGLEMRQNAGFARWSADRVDAKLHEIMADLHGMVADEARALPRASGTISGDSGALDYRRGANVAAYRRLAAAMIEGGAI